MKKILRDLVFDLDAAMKEERTSDKGRTTVSIGTVAAIQKVVQKFEFTMKVRQDKLFLHAQ